MLACLAVSGSVVGRRRGGGRAPRPAPSSARPRLGPQRQERPHPARGAPGPCGPWHRRRRCTATSCSSPVTPVALEAFDTSVSTPGITDRSTTTSPPERFAAAFGPSPATIGVGPGLARGPGPRCRRRRHGDGLIVPISGTADADRPGLRRRARAVPAAVGARRARPRCRAPGAERAGRRRGRGRPASTTSAGPSPSSSDRRSDVTATRRARVRDGEGRRRAPSSGTEPHRGLLQHDPGQPRERRRAHRRPSWLRPTRSRASTPAATRRRG